MMREIFLDDLGRPNGITKFLINERGWGQTQCPHQRLQVATLPSLKLEREATSQKMQAAQNLEKTRKYTLLYSLQKEHSPEETFILAQEDPFPTPDLQN